MAPPSNIGLIAGAGELPLRFLQQARRRGCSVKTAAIRGSAHPSIEKLSDTTVWISLGQLGALISFFKKQGIKRAVMHGKVQHSQMFRNLRLDWKALAVWSRLKNRSGGALLRAVMEELSRAGITLLDSRTFMEEVLIPKGWLTRNQADAAARKTVAYGLKQARVLARAGVGQAVVVKGNAVVAVEAMEGTDETVRRAGKWAGRGTILVKTAGPKQDWRYDVPTLGPRTIQSLILAKSKGIVVEAGRTFLLNWKKTAALAEKNGIFILAV